MCIGMHLGKDSFSVVSKNGMGEETHKHYCQIVLSTKTRIFIWEEKKKKRKPRKGKKISQTSESALSFGDFSLERKHMWGCEHMTCALLNAGFSETSFILLDSPSLPEVKSVSSACLMMVVTP